MPNQHLNDNAVLRCIVRVVRVSFKYRIIRLTATQCCLVDWEVNFATLLTAKAMSSLVLVDRLGDCQLLTGKTFDPHHHVPQVDFTSLVEISTGMSTELAFLIPNFSNISSMYAAWPIQTPKVSWFYTQKVVASSPRSFTSKCWPSASLTSVNRASLFQPEMPST